MATFVPKILNPLLTYTPSTGVEEFTSYASKAMRLKIILDRHTRGFEKADRTGGRGSYQHEPSNSQKGGRAGELKSHRQILQDNNQVDERTSANGYLFEQPKEAVSQVQDTGDYITIVDYDYATGTHDDKRYYDKLKIPFVPRELNIEPESNFVGIASFGRNNPIYQFTGSEDTITFDIDWHSDQANREDVIFNCRWIEALSKADGYDEMPHRVMIIWGNGNKLFQDHLFILEKAPYKLSQFVKGYKDPKTGERVSTSMLPQQAIQRITLKRLTETNLTSREIIGKVGVPTSYRKAEVFDSSYINPYFYEE